METDLQTPIERLVLPAVAVEFEAALEALHAPFDLGEVVRLAATRAGGVFGVEVGGGSGGGWGSCRSRRKPGHRPNTIRSSSSSATVARSASTAQATHVVAAAANARGPGA